MTGSGISVVSAGHLLPTSSSGAARPEAQGSFDSAVTAVGGPPAHRVGARVTVVEDDPDIRLYLTRLLAGDGCEVLPFGDAEAAWASLQSGYGSAIDLLLRDDPSLRWQARPPISGADTEPVGSAPDGDHQPGAPTKPAGR